MGILDNLSRNKSKLKNTNGFYFGSAEAEGENNSGIQNFSYYFDDYLGILPQLSNGKFIFTGRKGSGKTAIAKYIKDESDKDDESYSDLIRLNDLEIEKMIQLDELSDFKNIESVLFEWLILTRLIKLILKNNEGKFTNEYQKLEKFIERNSGVVEIDKFQITEIIKQRKFEIKIDVLKHVFPSISKNFDSKTTKAPFYKLINPLKEIVKKILSYQNNEGKEFWLLFDDLDINFRESNFENIDRITELIRIAKLYNTEILASSNARILIFLRDDIKDIIENHNTDTAKIFASYEIMINWYLHDNYRFNENKTSLKKFINKRIEQNFKANNIEYNEFDPWKSLFEETPLAYHNKSSFKYIIDYTFYRPRDLILFFKAIGENHFEYPLDNNTVKRLIIHFLKENIREIRNELSIYFTPSEIQDIISFLRNMANNGSISPYRELISKLEEFNFNKSANDVIKILLSYSLIVPIDNDNNLYFSYREDSIDSISLNELNYTTHKSIYTFFNPRKV